MTKTTQADAVFGPNATIVGAAHTNQRVPLQSTSLTSGDKPRLLPYLPSGVLVVESKEKMASQSPFFLEQPP